MYICSFRIVPSLASSSFIFRRFEPRFLLRSGYSQSCRSLLQVPLQYISCRSLKAAKSQAEVSTILALCDRISISSSYKRRTKSFSQSACSRLQPLLLAGYHWHCLGGLVVLLKKDQPLVGERILDQLLGLSTLR